MGTAEQSLWAMVLIQATLDLLQIRSMIANRLNKKLAWQARVWLESGQTHIGSFEWVCDHIGFDAPSLRREIFELDRATVRAAVVQVHTNRGAQAMRRTGSTRIGLKKWMQNKQRRSYGTR